MKRMKWLLVFVFLTCSCFVMAQAAKSAEPHTAGEVLDHYIANVEGEFVPAAEAMPENVRQCPNLKNRWSAVSQNVP